MLDLRQAKTFVFCPVILFSFLYSKIQLDIRSKHLATYIYKNKKLTCLSCPFMKIA